MAATFCIKGAAIGREPENGPQYGEILGDGTTYTLTTAEIHAVSTTGPLTAGMRSPRGTEAVDNGYLVPVVVGGEGVRHPLTAGGSSASEDGSGRGVPVVAFNWQSGGDCRINASPLPDALSVGQTPAVMTGDPLYYSHDYNQDRVYGDTGPAPALTAADSNRTRNHLIAGTVRRLTPTECERLMGWPDGWTEVGGDGKRIKDGPRYRLCGNGVVGTVAEWIARRLMDVIRRNPA